MSIQPTKGSGITLLELKLRAKGRELEVAKAQARKRNILVLVEDYLLKNGYTDSLERLQTESAVNLNKFQPADNMDLNTIFNEFEEFFTLKYQKQAKFVRNSGSEDTNNATNIGKKSKHGFPPLPPGMSSVSNQIPAAYRNNYANSEFSPDQLGSSDGAAISNDNSNTNNIMAPRRNNSAGSNRQSTGQTITSSGTSTPVATNSSKSNPNNTSTVTQSKSHKKKKASATTINAESTNDTNLISVTGKSSATPVNANQKQQPTAIAAGVLHNQIFDNKTNSDPNANSKNNTKAGTAVEIDDDLGETAENVAAANQEYFDTRVLKPIPDYLTGQYRELAEVITRDIFSTNPNVRWSDIAELEGAKQLLKEAVVMPLRFPQFFTGLLAPWKGILLYGPPGTGKTMLARAVATECHTTFFNISASTIVSKYRGDSEKLVRVLFELARYHAPSTIFIDEIDSLLSSRDSQSSGEHEGSRRMKTEILTQMDGLSKTNHLVFVLAASNLPWDLDIALLRRLEKRILVPLPNEKARLAIIKQNLQERSETKVNFNLLAKKTENYSGADLVLLCKEAAMRPVRRLMKSLMQVQILDTNNNANQQDIDSEVKLDLVNDSDITSAMKCTKPSAAVKYLNKYDEWHQQYGATIDNEDY